MKWFGLLTLKGLIVAKKKRKVFKMTSEMAVERKRLNEILLRKRGGKMKDKKREQKNRGNDYEY